MSSPWIDHVKAYAKKNNISYKQALTEARASYKQAGSGAAATKAKQEVKIHRAHRQLKDSGIEMTKKELREKIKQLKEEKKSGGKYRNIVEL